MLPQEGSVANVKVDCMGRGEASGTAGSGRGHFSEDRKSVGEVAC